MGFLAGKLLIFKFLSLQIWVKIIINVSYAMIYHAYLDTLKVDLCVYDIMQCLKAAMEKNCFEPLINNIVRNLVVNYETLNRCVHTH